MSVFMALFVSLAGLVQAAPSTSPCPRGLVRVTYEFGLQDSRTGCFTAAGRTLRGHRQGRWVFTSTVGNHPAGDPLTVVGRYRNGKRHGRWTTTIRREDGGCEEMEYFVQKAAAGRYFQGKKHGVWRYVLGKVSGTKHILTATYKAGALHGKYRGSCSPWRSSREWRERGSYFRGKRSGSWARIRCDGKRKEWGKYRAGKRHGLWFIWSSNRRYDRKCRYRAGRQVGRCQVIKDTALRRVFKGHRNPFRRGGPLGPPR